MLRGPGSISGLCVGWNGDRSLYINLFQRFRSGKVCTCRSVREGERGRCGIVIVGWCVCPFIHITSFITSDLIFPRDHPFLSVSARTSVCIHPAFKYRFQQDYQITAPPPNPLHDTPHTYTHTAASQHTLSPHFNPKSP